MKRAALCLLFACHHAASKPNLAKPIVGSGAMQSQIIDARGGGIALEVVTLTVPPGALAQPQTVTLTSTTTAAPSASALTALYQFAPDGLSFALPATVQIQAPASQQALSIYWERPDQSGYDELPTMLKGGILYAATLHFTHLYVAPKNSAPPPTTTFTGKDASVQVVPDTSGGSRTVTLPVDFTASGASLPKIYSYDGSGFTAFTVTADASGNFSATSVPLGTTFLQYQRPGETLPSWFVTGEHTIDLTHYSVGQPAATVAADQLDDTHLVVSVSYPDPQPVWEGTSNNAENGADSDPIYNNDYVGDSVQLYAPAAGFYGWGNNQPPDGPFAWDWSWLGTSTLLAGEDTYVYRLTMQKVGSDGRDKAAIIQYATHLPITMTGGTTTNVTAALAPVPPEAQRALSFTWQRTAMLGMAQSVGARVRKVDCGWAIDRQPKADAARGQLGGTPDLATGAINREPDQNGAMVPDTNFAFWTPTEDLTFNATIGDPFPEPWDTILIRRCDYQARYSVGYMQSTIIDAYANQVDTLTSAGGNFGPTLSPVTHIALDGAPATSDLAGVSPTPVLSWSAPTLGVPGLYTVQIIHLTQGLSDTNQENVATLNTPATQLPIPSGLLLAGERYVFRITATSSGTADADIYPETPSLPLSNMDALSGLVTVAKAASGNAAAADLAAAISDANVYCRLDKRGLFVGASITNSGSGAFEVIRHPDHSVWQREWNDDGSFIDKAVSASFAYKPAFADFLLQDWLTLRLVQNTPACADPASRDGSCVVASNDFTFCDADSSGTYTRHSCQAWNPGIAAGATMSISSTNNLWQQFDISNLAAGTYRLELEVDAARAFDDMDASNNLAATTVTIPPASACALAPTAVYFNGVVHTVDAALGDVTAVAIQGDTLAAVGSDTAMKALAVPGTTLIDLQGATVVPGFVDAHSHQLQNYAENIFSGGGASLDDAQAQYLQGGVTSVGQMGIERGALDQVFAFDGAGLLKLRVADYIRMNDNCGRMTDQYLQTYAPVRQPRLRHRVPGVKIFSDGGTCWGPASSHQQPSPDAAHEQSNTDYGQLFITPAMMLEAMRLAESLGYQVAVHGIGDLAHDEVVYAYAQLLDGAPNLFRHRLEHNDSVRLADQPVPSAPSNGPVGQLGEGFAWTGPAWAQMPWNALGKLPAQVADYDSLGLVAVLWGYYPACNEQTYFDPFIDVTNQHPWAEIFAANPNLHAAWHTDYEVVPPFLLNPMVEFYGFATFNESPVTGASSGFASTCVGELSAHAITRQQALYTMTMGSAYALHTDSVEGSLTPGKLADFTILSGDLMGLPIDAVPNISVLATFVYGTNAYCAPSESARCQ